MSNINKSIAKGAVWMVLMRLSIKCIGAISTLILVRLLAPDDFGIMVMATSVIALVDLIRAFGFDTVLIQRQDARDEHYNTAWTMQIIFGLIACTFLVLLAEPAASYYGDIRLVNILQILAINIMINGFTNIGVVEFRKGFNFNREFTYNVIRKLCSFVVTIILAWYWKSYWALLVGMLTGNVVSLILSYTMVIYRPTIDLQKWKELLSFSSWLLFNNILTFLNQHSQNFILGKISTSSEVGLLGVSREIASISSTEIAASINRAAFPGYSKVAENTNELKESFLLVYGNIALIIIPSAVGIIGLAPLLVPVLFGEVWFNAVDIVKIIALSSAMTALINSTHHIYLAQTKQKIITALSITGLLIFLPTLYYLVPLFGAIGAAYAILIKNIVIFPVTILVLMKQLKLTMSELSSIFYRPIISSVIMYLIVDYSLMIMTLNFENVMNIFFLMGFVIEGVFLFILIILFMWWLAGKPNGAEKNLIYIISNKIKR